MIPGQRVVITSAPPPGYRGGAFGSAAPAPASAIIPGFGDRPLLPRAAAGAAAGAAGSTGAGGGAGAGAGAAGSFSLARDTGLYGSVSAAGADALRGFAAGSSGGAAAVSGSGSGAAAGGAAASAAASAATSSTTSMLVSTKQRGNPLLKHIRHVLWEYSGAIAPDYLPSAGTAVLYISLKYHALHPTYLYKRLREVRSDYRLRVVLVYTDVSDVERLLLDISRIAILCDWTVVCAATLPEAARYLETWRVYEHKPATAIKERVEDTYLPKVTELLTSIRSINKTDVLTLLSRFHSVAGVMSASLAELQTCPGIAEKKAQRIHDAFHKPLLGGGHRGSGGSAHAGGSADSSALAGAADRSVLSAEVERSDGVPHDPETALGRLLALADEEEDGDAAGDAGRGEDVEALEAMAEAEARDRGRGGSTGGSSS